MAFQIFQSPFRSQQRMKWTDFISRVTEEIQIEKQRYARTKYGKMVAFLIYCAAFAFVPEVLQAAIPFLNRFMELRYVQIAVVLTTLTVFTLAYNFAMVFVYRSKAPFFEQYRINPSKPWPWEEDPQKWSKTMWRSIGFTVINIYGIGGISLLVEAYVDFGIEMEVTQRLEIKWILLQYLVMVVSQDLILFGCHYAFHHPFLYQNFHKIHHEYTTSVSIAGQHIYFVEYAFTQSCSNLICLKLAQLIGPLNISTLIIWILFRMGEAFNQHCGYIFSWMPPQILPFSIYDEFHDFHHTHNCGNYASYFRIWDMMSGTYQAFREYKKKQFKLRSGKAQE